ncbi:MAG: rod shape-determining protein MreC [Bacteroidota bacterium]|nr:rod shape-determining protein MreC [Bacteroidota bacterium]
MRNLIKFISLYNYSITFLVLLFISSYFLINENFILKTKYFNSSNYISGTVLSYQTSITNYFNLEEKNTRLERENKHLKEKIINSYYSEKEDSVSTPNNNYKYINAEVINNSIRKSKNYITINKGSKDGIKVGMGVISSTGIVGKVKYVSENFSTIISLLNTSFYISSIIEKTNTLSSVNWSGIDPATLKLLYVPKHIEINNGDEVTTSSFDSVFPKGISIGKVNNISREINSNFYDIDILSTQNFYNLSTVYVVNYLVADEKVELEKKTAEE